MSSESATSEELTREVHAFLHYLRLPVNDSLRLKISDQYIVFHQTGKINPGGDERKLLRHILAKRWMIGPVDSALAFSDPYHVIRRKIHLVLAIAETQPGLAEFFLHPPKGKGYLLRLPFIGFGAGFKYLTGKIILSVWR